MIALKKKKGQERVGDNARTRDAKGKLLNPSFPSHTYGTIHYSCKLDSGRCSYDLEGEGLENNKKKTAPIHSIQASTLRIRELRQPIVDYPLEMKNEDAADENDDEV